MSIAAGTETTTSLDALEALDWEPELPCAACEAHGKSTELAVCYLVRSCGCPAAPHCAGCRDRCLDYVREIGAVRCMNCEADPITVRFEPIKKSH